MPAIFDGEAVLERAEILIKGLHALQVPVLFWIVRPGGWESPLKNWGHWRKDLKTPCASPAAAPFLPSPT